MKHKFTKIITILTLTLLISTTSAAEDTFVKDEIDFETLDSFTEGELGVWTESSHSEDSIPSTEELKEIHELSDEVDEEDTVGDGERVDLGMVFSDQEGPELGEEIKLDTGDGFLEDKEEYEDLNFALLTEDYGKKYTRIEDKSLNTEDEFKILNKPEKIFNFEDTPELVSDSADSNEILVDNVDSVYVSRPKQEVDEFIVDRKPLELNNAEIVDEPSYEKGATAKITIENKGPSNIEEHDHWSKEDILDGFDKEDLSDFEVIGDEATFEVDLGTRTSNDYDFQIGSSNAVEDEVGNKLEESNNQDLTVEDIRTYPPEIESFELKEGSSFSEPLVDDDKIEFTLEISDKAEIDSDSTYIDTKAVGESDTLNLDEDCFNAECDVEMTVDTDVEDDINFELISENEVIDETTTSETDPVTVKGGRADIESIELHGEGELESIRFETSESLDKDSFDPDAWTIYTSLEGSNETEITSMKDLEKDNWYELNVDSDYNSSDANRFSIGYEPDSDNHLYTETGRRFSSVNGEPVSEDGDIKEDDMMKPEAVDVHWREGLDRFAIEFTEEVKSLEIESESCDGCEDHQVAGNNKNFAIVDYEDNIPAGSEEWSFGVENLETGFEDGDKDLTEIEFSSESEEKFPVLSEEMSEDSWDLISLANDDKYVDLDQEYVEQSYFFNSENQIWSEAENVSAERGVYIRAEKPLILEINDLEDDDDTPSVPSTQSSINDGLNLVSPVNDEEGPVTRTAVNWFSESINDFVSEIISPEESQVNVDGDMDELTEDCWENSSWVPDNDECDGEVVDGDGFSPFEGYWVNVQED